MALFPVWQIHPHRTEIRYYLFGEAGIMWTVMDGFGLSESRDYYVNAYAYNISKFNHQVVLKTMFGIYQINLNTFLGIPVINLYANVKKYIYLSPYFCEICT